MLVGAAAMIEMVYHLQLDATPRPEAALPRPRRSTRSRPSSWLGALAVALIGFAAVRVVRRRFAASVGHGSRARSRPTMSFKEPNAAVPEGGEAAARGGQHGRAMSEPTPAVELKDLRKTFGKTEIIRGADLAVAPGERVAIIGPNGAGKSTLFNLISGRFGPTSGEILLNGKRIDGLQPYEINRLGLARSFQITNIFARLSVFENLRCGVLWSLGYRYAFWKFLADLHDANERAEQLLAMIKLDAQARHAGDEPHLRRAARARDRHHDRRRRRRDPARRADRRHEQERDDALRRADPRGDRRQDAADGRARHGRRVRPGRQDRGAGLRRGDRLRRARGGARQRARAGGVSRLGAGRAQAAKRSD